MSTPWFFLSYASIGKEHDGQVAKFCQDLRDALRVIAQLDKRVNDEEIGFFAPEMGDGKSWPKGVADNLRTCHVLVCLYSGKYFTSPQCGKEFALFSARLDAHAAASGNGERPPRVLPVLWVVPDGFPDSLPLAASNIHYRNDYTDRLIEAKGLFQLKTVHGDRAGYKKYVFYLAGHINEVANATVLKELAEADPFEKIPNAWVEPPAAPVALDAALVAPRQIKLTWEDGESDAEEGEPAAGNGSAKPARRDGFQVERLWHGGRAGFSKIKTVRADSFRYTDARVSSGTKYRYRVRAFNSGGCSEYVETEDVETQGEPPPPMPSGLSGHAVSAHEVELSWVDNSGGRAFFRIERCDAPPDGSFKEIGKAEPGVTSYEDGGLEPSTTYVYRVCAFNDNEDDDHSDYDEVEVTTLPLPPPPPPPTFPWLLLAVVAIVVAIAVVVVASTQRLRCLVVPSLCAPAPPPTPLPTPTPMYLLPPGLNLVTHWSDVFIRQATNNRDKYQWDSRNNWDVPEGQWEPVEEASKDPVNKALKVYGEAPGVVKRVFENGKPKEIAFPDFKVEFTIKFVSGTKAGWILRAQGDRQHGFSGYYFVLTKPDIKGGFFKLDAWACGAGDASPADRACEQNQRNTFYNDVIGLRDYLNSDERIRVMINVVGDKFHCAFTMEDLSEGGESDGPFAYDMGDKEGRFAGGTFGLFADRASHFVVHQVTVIPPAGQSPK